MAGRDQTVGKIGVLVDAGGIDRDLSYPAAVDCFVPASGVADGRLALPGRRARSRGRDDQGLKVAGTPVTADDPCELTLTAGRDLGDRQERLDRRRRRRGASCPPAPPPRRRRRPARRRRPPPPHGDQPRAPAPDGSAQGDREGAHQGLRAQGQGRRARQGHDHRPDASSKRRGRHRLRDREGRRDRHGQAPAERHGPQGAQAPQGGRRRCGSPRAAAAAPRP